MSEEKELIKAASLSVETILKWIPVVFVIIGFIFAFGKRDDKNEYLGAQNAALQTRVDGLTKDLQDLKDRVTRIEANADANQRYVDQDKAFREQVKK